MKIIYIKRTSYKKLIICYNIIIINNFYVLFSRYLKRFFFHFIENLFKIFNLKYRFYYLDVRKINFKFKKRLSYLMIILFKLEKKFQLQKNMDFMDNVKLFKYRKK